MSEPEQTSPLVGETVDYSDSGGGPGGTPRDLTGLTLGDFQVERMLGRGGMGEVYLARQISLNRPVALKVLRSELLSKPTYLGRFEAEATAVAKLNHPNIVHVYMLGHVDGIRFIAMEYVQGTNLREYLQKKGALDLPLALSIMKQAGMAIGAAGEIGLVHRDVKPENLLLTRKGQVKVADFGLCRDQDTERLQLTQTGITMGTPLYMSPEQAQGHAIDHRSDLYSLGVTFYHMLAGSPPFRADTALAVALKHVKDTAVRPSVHRPDIPLELDRLVMKLMAKDPAERYQSAAEMLRDLAKVKETLHVPSVAIPAADLGAGSNGSTPVAITPTPTPKSGPSALSRLRASGAENRLTVPRLSPFQKIGLVAIGLAIGLAWGWFSRPVDLLAEGAAKSSAMPALWMAPDWDQAIQRQANPEAQYHYALLAAPPAEQEAAWVAVPGYYPDAREYNSKAYIQLARVLLRRHDLDRLRVFGAELANWKADRTHGEELATIVQAAVDSLDQNVDGAVAGLKELNTAALIDPALVELALEVTWQAMKAASRPGVPQLATRRLNEIQTSLRNSLYLNASFREPQAVRQAR